MVTEADCGLMVTLSMRRWSVGTALEINHCFRREEGIAQVIRLTISFDGW